VYSEDAFIRPEDLVKRAALLGLEGVAITDHNEIKGALRAVELAKGLDLKIIPGEEAILKAILVRQDKACIGIFRHIFLESSVTGMGTDIIRQKAFAYNKRLLGLRLAHKIFIFNLPRMPFVKGIKGNGKKGGVQVFSQESCCQKTPHLRQAKLQTIQQDRPSQLQTT
jgi:hypothetical protein